MDGYSWDYFLGKIWIKTFGFIGENGFILGASFEKKKYIYIWVEIVLEVIFFIQKVSFEKKWTSNLVLKVKVLI